jgi:hypothetical protein
MIKLDLSGQTNKLEKTFKLAKKYDEDRNMALKKDCDALRTSSATLKGMCCTLGSKLDALENIMGIYSAKEKHKL